jgi:hypothetical protein
VDALTKTSIVQAGWFGLLHHPNFRAAAERNAAGVLDQYDRRGPILRWLTKDLGRVSTLTRLFIIGAREGEVSVADVLARVRRRRTVSDGAVLRLFARASQAGLIRMTPQNGPWNARKLAFEPPLLRLYRERAAVEIEAASLVAPEIRPALALVGREGFFLAFMAALGRFDGMAPEARGPANPGMRLFMERDAGLMMLYDLMLSQAPGRERLLEAAPLSKAHLARRFTVSRSHVARQLAEAEARGHLSLPTPERVVFNPAMNEEAGRHFAVTFLAIKMSALAALAEIGRGAGAREA